MEVSHRLRVTNHRQTFWGQLPVQDFCAAAIKLLVPEQIQIPDEGRLREIESGWALPQCVGAIGSYVRTVTPQDSDTDYCNRDGLHSIILQGVVDGRGKF